jgi:hypothetical protein
VDDDLYAIFGHDDDESAGATGSAPLVALLHELLSVSSAIDDELDAVVVDDELRAAMADVRSVYAVLGELEAKVRAS